MSEDITDVEVKEIIGVHIDLSPEGVETTALSVIHHVLCRMRTVHAEPELVLKLSDSLYGLPAALLQKDYRDIRRHTIQAILADRDIQERYKKMIESTKLVKEKSA